MGYFNNTILFSYKFFKFILKASSNVCLIKNAKGNVTPVIWDCPEKYVFLYKKEKNLQFEFIRKKEGKKEVQYEIYAESNLAYNE